MSNNVHEWPAPLHLDQERAISEGILLGYDKLDGLIPPGYQYAAYVQVNLNVVRESA